ncbi:MAG: HAD family hydrolase [Ruminococcaceae bacterium]|nr:HAD family hydrolase [Oscillospiraceae bacterium]
MKKVLYVSDLDGTLLNSRQQVSSFSEKTITAFVENGGLFTYATARSLVSASVITKNIPLTLPVIVNNGVRMMDPVTGEILSSKTFSAEEFLKVMSFLKEREVSPIVYSRAMDGDRFSYVEKLVSPETKAFLDPKKNDPRSYPVESEEELCSGEAYYFVCIGEDKRIKEIYDAVTRICPAVTYIDIYSGHRWIEIMPRGAGKAESALELKERLGADELVVFGDGGNDLSMFDAADGCYAVENADERLKIKADGVIESNENDGVARWLLENALQ